MMKKLQPNPELNSVELGKISKNSHDDEMGKYLGSVSEETKGGIQGEVFDGGLGKWPT